MREPNMKELVESLASENFIEAVFANGRDTDAEIMQLLYFMKEDQTATLYKEISKLSLSRKRNVFVSLAQLYPISQNIIFTLLRKREATPIEFLDIYDMNRQLLSNILTTLEEIRDNSTATSIRYNRYMEEIREEEVEIDQLRNDIERLNDVSAQLKDKREKKEQLQIQLVNLQKDYESGGLDADIKELEISIQELSLKKEKKIKEKKILEQELNEIKESLKQDEDNATRKYRRVYAELEKCIKSIE